MSLSTSWIYRNSILCLQSSGNIHPSVPKHLHLHALSDKIMKQKSPVGSCGKRFSSFPSRNFNSWVQTLPGPNTSHLQKSADQHAWSKCFCWVKPESNSAGFHWKSLQQRLSAASILVIPEHCPCGKERNQQSAGTAPDCALNGWKTVIVLSGFQQFKLTKKGELRNPARSESDWSYTNCPPKK